MTINEQRPYNWTSTDAPGLLRYDEVAAGVINHAFRSTVPVRREAFVAPASHWASSNSNGNAPPGHALALESQLRHFEIFRREPSHPHRAQSVRDDSSNGSGIYLIGALDKNWSGPRALIGKNRQGANGLPQRSGSHRVAHRNAQE
jgi:hypothetical protein